ncbi:MAG: type II toxin-antitoxin system PemK/MazF family toxin [Pirellulales bacterium]
MAKTGAVVVVDFPGVQGIKRRPSVVVSSDVYHRSRPDVIIGLLTSQTDSATGPTDYLLKDWQAAGLQKPSTFRAFLVTLPRTAITATIGQLSDHDQREVAARINVALMT